MVFAITDKVQSFRSAINDELRQVRRTFINNASCHLFSFVHAWANFLTQSRQGAEI